MILKKNKDKNEKVNIKILDKRNYFFFALFGVLLIAVLMIVQTRFKESVRLNNDGFAVVSNTITEYLSRNPSEEDVESLVKMQGFRSMDYIYTQGGKSFLGDKKKTEIDTSYPLYINQGAVLQLLNDIGVLYDQNYEKEATYEGLYLQGGYAYNRDGEKADYCKYTFLGMKNGNFINFDTITYSYKQENYDINENSLVHFDSDYFSYFEYEKGELLYKYCISVNDSFKLKVGDKEYTYDELLKLLGLRSEHKYFEGIDKEEPVEEEPDTADEIEAEENLEKNETNKNPNKQEVEAPSAPTKGGGQSNTNSSPGVRPDNVTRPGSGGETERLPEGAPGYVQPTVTINSVTPYVYRIIVNATINDPANRIDANKHVRFEVYEVDDDDSEQLVMRSYRRGSGQDNTVLGGGSIKPDTRYRITSFYTYYDEYDREQYVDLGSWNVTTGKFEDLSDVTLVHEQGGSYNNFIEIINFGYDSALSDAELVYGINPYGGMKFIVKEESTQNVVTTRTLSTAETSNFKRNSGIVLTSLSTLKAKTRYQYEFVAEDYFGNEIVLNNRVGYAMTSNNAPCATIIEKTNEIGNIVLTMSIKDNDVAAVPSYDTSDAEDAYDVYFIISKEDLSRYSSRYSTFSELEQAGLIVDYKKLSPSEYSFNETDGLTVSDLDIQLTDLRLGEKFFATVFADYDLTNQRGPQYFKNIGQISFKTTDLNSLGMIYVTSDLDLNNLTYKSLPMSFHLNKVSTNDQLENLITGMKVEIVRGNGQGDDAIVDATFRFDETTLAADETTRVLDMFKDSAVSYFADNLQSMTEYRINATIYAKYNDEEYEIIPQLTNYTFKTMRRPAEVTVKDSLFAAGILVFDVKVDDPDETIIGVSKDKVLIQLYTKNGEFVKTLRVTKNTEDWQEIRFDNLDPEMRYELRFVASEYNEGYTNASYVSNKVIKVIEVDKSMSLTGTIKLQAINNLANISDKYQAVVKASLIDTDHYLSGENAIPYYIKVERVYDDEVVLVEDIAFDLSGETVSSFYEKNHFYEVLKGEYTYQLTMYIIVNGRQVELDTLSFTTETTVKGFSTAYEMIQLLRNDSDGKFVATNSFVLNSNTWNYAGVVDPGDVSSLTKEEVNALGQGISGANIVNIFDGTIDFQGFTLSHNIYADNQRMFTNIGSKGVVQNIVYSVKNLNGARIYDDASLCYRNFGTIRDIYVKYRGGYVLNNEYYGILTRVNSSTGLIENFVIENVPDEGFAGLSAYRFAGLVTYDNYGTIRYGYVYGDNIITTPVQQSITREIGGIAGANRTLGNIYSVYSLVNVDDTKMRPAPNDAYTYSNYYGAVCGQSWGKISNVYSTKDSATIESKHNGTYGYQHSPIIGGRNNATNSNVFYYSQNTYSEAASRTKAYKLQLNQLYDITWQRSMLTDNFDVSLVEVGYYPHVNLSDDLPEQEYIALPERQMTQPVEISRATVLNYGTTADGTDYADVQFVFTNRDGLDIIGVDIENIDIELDLQSARYSDGYTTIEGIISNPRTFYSEYEIQSISYYRNGRIMSNAVNYTLKADFFRKIYTVDDWYNYMVNRTNASQFENVKLEADLNFENINPSRIMVKLGFNRILDGNGHKIEHINLQRGFNASNNTTIRRLFIGDIAYSGVVRNLFINDYKAGGTYYNSSKGKTYIARSASVLGTVYGKVENVHVTDEIITTYEYAAGLVCYLAASGEIKDSSVTNLTIIYNDPDDVNADSYVGGIVGRMNESRVTHCYVQGIDIQVDETKSTYGIGGVVGYASNSVVDTAYAEGKIVSRAQKVGGIVGHYYCTNASVACMKNMWAKVDIICYTDIAGALVGQTNITQDRISATNNFTGIGLGNVYLSNLDSVNCSQTIGINLGKNVTFYGSEQQLINGISGVGYSGKEDCVRGLIPYEDLIGDNAADSYFKVVGFENVYRVSADGKLPKMYYTDRNSGISDLLPNQKDIVLDELIDRGIEIRVRDVLHNASDRIVTVELENSNNYKITGINIDKLRYHFVDIAAGEANYPNAVPIDRATDYYQGITRIYLQYETELNQEYFLDSYVMDNITFYPVENSGIDSSLVTGGQDERIPIYSRINVMLCKDIPNYNAWNEIPGRGAEHDYENYRLTGEIDFSTGQTATNVKIGRLISDNGDRTIKNVSIKGQDMHLISRLNSGISGVNFDNIAISSSGVGCIGIVGVSNGTIINCDFSNITISPQSNNTDEIGIIGHSNGGVFRKISLNNVSINANKSSLDYVGGLLGKVQDGSTFDDIQASNINIMGTGNYIGGVVGATETSNVNKVNLADIVVDGRGSYTGGFGGQIGYTSNASVKVLTEIELIGTPTYDSEGRVTDSTTRISGNNYVGGIAGHTHQKVGTSYVPNKSEPNLNVNGVVVSGLNRIGGAFGGTYTGMNHLTVQNALVKTRTGLMSNTATYTSIGGIIGTTSWSSTRDLYADNVVIDAINTNYIGGISGMIQYASMQYCYVNNCVIKGSEAVGLPDSTRLSNVGGLTGLFENSMYYNGVMNTIIDAPDHSNVGGIVGRLSQSLANNHYIGNCFYLASYDTQKEHDYNLGLNSVTRYTAAAVDDYYIKGFTNVGGIVGMQNSGYIHTSYSNGNVIAANGQIAGGISGMYCNEYTTSISNGKLYYTYSVAGMYRNYFAGNVVAINGYAGGAIGRTGMLYRSLGLDENNVISSSGKNGNRRKGINSNTNEENKTYGNMIIADKIIGGINTTGAFAADDETFVFSGLNNRIWDKTYVNGNFVASITNSSGKHVYKYWNEANEAITAYPASNVQGIQLFQSTDMDGSKTINSYHNRASVFYRSIGWSLKYSSNAAVDRVDRDSTWRVSVGHVANGALGIRGLYNKYETTRQDTGTYLPQPRQSTTTMYKDDILIHAQETVCRLPLPRDSAIARPLGNVYSTYGMRTVDNTYGFVYAADIDKLNVEFSKDLVDTGYFVLKAGNTMIANEVITQRTYTFSYPFNENITFEYGFLNDNTLDDSEILYAGNYSEIESVLLGVNDLKTDIMVYHNDYYYISEDGLVSSLGTWAGDFVHIMNGKALDVSGNIWDVESKKIVDNISATQMLDEAIPLWNFTYGGIQISTFAKYSSIQSEYNTIERNSQIFVVNDELYTVDGSLETRKTDILIYNLNGDMYQTVLGNDGMMVDMMQDDFNIPEEVENEAIVRMSNTLNASVPYVLVEYNNGGIIGYNYATGDILFDNRIENNVSLWDYAVSFFSDNRQSQYANISNTYSSNAKLSEQIRSTADLDKIIGNSSNELVLSHGNGENTASSAGIQDKADNANAQAGTGVSGSSDAWNGQGSDTEEGVDDGTEGTFVSTEESEPENATKNESENGNDSSIGKTQSNNQSSSSEAKEDKDDSQAETEASEKNDDTEKNSETEKNKNGSSDTKNASENPSSGTQVTDNKENEVGAGEFMTVYNNETGVYEIVSVAEYLTKDAYISENHRLGIKDLSQHINGYAVSTMDENQKRGIFIYIIPILIIFCIAGGIFIYVKRNERKM